MSTESVRARLNAATPGPWRWNVASHVEHTEAWDETVVVRHISAGGDDSTVAEIGRDFSSNNVDAEFIAHARTDLERALDVIEAVPALVDIARRYTEEYGWSSDLEALARATDALQAWEAAG